MLKCSVVTTLPLVIGSLLLVVARLDAVTLENESFHLEAGQIRFKPGNIEASQQVVMIIKDSRQLKKLEPAGHFSIIAFTVKPPQKSVYLLDGWRLEGDSLSVTELEQSTLIEGNLLRISSVTDDS